MTQRFARSRARRLNLTRYFTGNPCPKGHIDERMAANGRCVACMKEYKLRPENVAKKLRRLSKARKNDPQKYRDKDRAARNKFPERIRAANIKSKRKAREKNPNKRTYLTPIQRKISNSMRCGVWRSIKEKKAGGKWSKLCGYSLKELMDHLERQFTTGMSWENYGEWEIDHIIPIASFNFDSPDHPDFKLCYALSNLRPLWEIENRKKWFKRIHLL